MMSSMGRTVSEGKITEEEEDITPSWLSPDDAFLLNDGNERDRKPDLVLYFYPHSINCMKVLMCLHEKGIPFTKIMVNINLGHQFHDDFLKLNPSGEVPVLRDRRNGDVGVDSDELIRKLNNLYPYRMNPKHKDLGAPEREALRKIHNQFLAKFRAARLETLLNGSVMFDEGSLGIKPNYPYSYPESREQIKEMVAHRVELLKSEARRVEKTNYDATKALRRKAAIFKLELPFMTIREKYEELILEIENLLNECEAQLRETGWGFWFLDLRFMHVDICFSLFLYRLWQIGFADRFWTREKRPYINHYFKKVQEFPCFKKVTHMGKARVESWPFVAGGALCLLAITYEVLFGN